MVTDKKVEVENDLLYSGSKQRCNNQPCVVMNK